jgi:hypothetical protein
LNGAFAREQTEKFRRLCARHFHKPLDVALRKS